MKLIHQARKRFGQNFLQDVGVINAIIAVISPQPGERLLEIGPGLGAITTRLLALTGKLTAIELDRDVIPLLRQNCQGLGELEIHQADVLTVNFSALTQGEPARIIGNLPYNISTPLLFHLLAQAKVVKDMHFMLQKEVVDRIAAQPGSGAYGRLSVMIQYQCLVEPLFTVGPEAFLPPPKVESAVLRITPYAKSPYPETDIGLLEKIVKQAFSQRRKTIWNNLKNLLSSSSDLERLGIDPKLRPEQLAIPDYVAISNSLANELGA